jgi:hypothetical protein
MAVPYDSSEVRAAFDNAAFRRAQGYAWNGAVRQLEVVQQGRLLLARVKGSARKLYSVEVTIAEDRKRRIVSYCTCPVGVQCKHGAAVMLAALGRRESAPERPVPAPKPAPAPPRDPLAGPVGDWLERLAATTATAKARPGPTPEQVLYVLDRRTWGEGHVTVLEPRVARPLKAGGWGAERAYHAANLVARQARFVRPEDGLIGRLLGASYSFGGPDRLPDDPDTVDLLLERALATGRCYWQSKDGPALGRGPDRPGGLAWHLRADGSQQPVLAAPDPGLVPLSAASPWYVDPGEGVAGRLLLDLPRAALPLLLHAPAVTPAQAEPVRQFLECRLGGVAVPPPTTEIVEEARKDPPRPVLTLTSHRSPWMAYRNGGDQALDLAFLHFDYGGMTVEPDDRRRSVRRVEGARVIVHRRQDKAERAALHRLSELGLHKVGGMPAAGKPATRWTLIMQSGLDADWWRLIHQDVARLEAEGWQVEIEPGFRHQVLDAAGEWEASLGEKAGWWFALELGVEVEGERLSLLPVLAAAVEQLRRGGNPGHLDDLDPGDSLYARLADGRVVALPVARVRPLLATLLELYDGRALAPDGRLEVSLGQALALTGAEPAAALRWQAGERLLELARALRGFAGIAAVDAPAGFGATLRPYQRDGLGWLQFLAEHGLGGLLADDMGLGKTVQTLAHILAEKRSGRLAAPCLVICPTSVVANWRGEAERLAPDLRLLVLHGPGRAAAFDAIADADLVLSTYALLPRDAEILLPVAWHLVVLDEAQAVKNPASKAHQLVCRLQAQHRLCLTGTPIENHLGELFAQMSILMPGLLGDRQRFTRIFRTPIEKGGDLARQEVLVGRVRPFLVRRTKSEVEQQLPAKTEIVQRIELAGAQRDLYETVRLAMHERVRTAIAAKGFARSQIVVLDALLKLRQVCCDPRLVRLAAAKKAAGASAKLQHLLEILPQLVEEGRRVLLFSQFTSMLDLIVPEVERAGIPFVELRGDTTDRSTPVTRFQDGRVPLFLLSLKAGGVGLNLTAADTVILYDPWWNPAVEAQAADRAHRIGQDKPVFVYKLIAEGTIEERLLELQARKRALAKGVLDGATGEFSRFDERDLELLLRPLA